MPACAHASYWTRKYAKSSMIVRGSPNSLRGPLRSRGKTVEGLCLPDPTTWGWEGSSNRAPDRRVAGPDSTWARCRWPRWSRGWASGAACGAYSLSPWWGNTPGAQITELPDKNIGRQVHIHQPQLGGLVPACIPSPHKVSPVINRKLSCLDCTHS